MTPEELHDLLISREADNADLSAQAAAWRHAAHELLDNMVELLAASFMETPDDDETLH